MTYKKLCSENALNHHNYLMKKYDYDKYSPKDFFLYLENINKQSIYDSLQYLETDYLLLNFKITVTEKNISKIPHNLNILKEPGVINELKIILGNKLKRLINYS